MIKPKVIILFPLLKKESWASNVIWKSKVIKQKNLGVNLKCLHTLDCY